MTTVEQIKAELENWRYPEGVSPGVLLELSEPLASALRKIIRQGSMTFPELAEALELSSQETEEVAEMLVERGFLKTSERRPDGATIFRLHHARTHRTEAPVAIWKKVMDEFVAEGEEQDADREDP